MDFDVAALGQMGAQHLGLVVQIDHDHGHAGRHQPVDGMIDQRLAAPP